MKRTGNAAWFNYFLEPVKSDSETVILATTTAMQGLQAKDPSLNPGFVDIHSTTDYSQPDDAHGRKDGDHPVITSVCDLDVLYEVFDERDGDIVPVHCSFCYRDSEGRAFFGRSTRNKLDLKAADYSKALTRIPDHEIYPEALPSTTVYPGKIDGSYYIKGAKLLDYEDFAGTDYLARVCLGEITSHEVIRRNPHPNIVRYHGCVVKRRRIIGMVLDRYAVTLHERVEEGDYGPFDTEAYMAAIESGVEHLHSFNLAHNDLNPKNIMLDDYDAPIIIDLGSCRPVGQELLTAGTPGWMDADYDLTSNQSNDQSALRMIRTWLRDHEATMSRLPP